MANNEIKKLFEVRVATSLFSVNGSSWTNNRQDFEYGFDDEISVTRKGTVYEVFDYGEPPDDFDTGDEELYNKWCDMCFEDGELARFSLKTKRSKFPGCICGGIEGITDDIAAGYLEIVPGTVNFKEIAPEYFSKIIKALEFRLGELWNQVLLSTQFVADIRNRVNWCTEVRIFIGDYENQEKLQKWIRISNKDLQKYEATLELYQKFLDEPIPKVE